MVAAGSRLLGGRISDLGGAMSRCSPFVIELSEEDRSRLESLVRKQTAERRMVVRAQIVLAAAEGEETGQGVCYGRAIPSAISQSPYRTRDFMS